MPYLNLLYLVLQGGDGDHRAALIQGTTPNSKVTVSLSLPFLGRRSGHSSRKVEQTVSFPTKFSLQGYKRRKRRHMANEGEVFQSFVMLLTIQEGKSQSAVRFECRPASTTELSAARVG